MWPAIRCANSAPQGLKMRLTPAQAAKLIRLGAGESLPKSEVPKSLLRPLQEAHAVRFEKSGPSYVVRGVPDKLIRAVEQIWGVRDLEKYAASTPDTRNRAVLSEIAADTKALPTSPFEGIFIRSFGQCYLGDQPLGITPCGSALLITLKELPQLQIRSKCLIGIEGVEAFWKFEKAMKYFPNLSGTDQTLVLRWRWSTAWREWLAGWSGQFLYFPDYDPAGIRIFLTEIIPVRPDTKLLIPQDFQSILNAHGSRELYLRQEKLLPSNTQHAEAARVCEALRRHRKGLEHEALLAS